MQTNAPESITKLDLILLLERQRMSLQVETNVRGTVTTPWAKSSGAGNIFSKTIIWLGSCKVMNSSTMEGANCWYKLGPGGGNNAQPSWRAFARCQRLLQTWRRLLCCQHCVRWRRKCRLCHFARMIEGCAGLGWRSDWWSLMYLWPKEMGSQKQNGRPRRTRSAKRICHRKKLEDEKRAPEMP